MHKESALQEPMFESGSFCLTPDQTFFPESGYRSCLGHNPDPDPKNLDPVTSNSNIKHRRFDRKTII